MTQISSVAPDMMMSCDAVTIPNIRQAADPSINSRLGRIRISTRYIIAQRQGLHSQ